MKLVLTTVVSLVLAQAAFAAKTATPNCPALEDETTMKTAEEIKEWATTEAKPAFTSPQVEVVNGCYKITETAAADKKMKKMSKIAPIFLNQDGTPAATTVMTK